MADLRKIADALAAGFEPGEREVLDAGSNHPGNCRCETCRKWWKMVGPDEDGLYGPFTEAEVKGA